MAFLRVMKVLGRVVVKTTTLRDLPVVEEDRVDFSKRSFDRRCGLLRV